MLRRLITAAAMAFAAFGALAQPINLKWSVENPKNNSRYESWIGIDTASNFMRIDGAALELKVTNDVYSSTTRPVAGFRTVRVIDRETGNLTITELYGSDIAWRHTGTCEKAEPPTRKF